MASTEFDAAMGGTEHLPNTANSFKFAASRSIEIAAMTECILRPSKTKLIFQTLPVHMRRRVMSHNCKRLPRRLREGHLEQMKKSGLPPKQKRPSRKYRRRPTNLLKEYTRRKRRIMWLETHIWHAKRFHMIERWGYRLAYRPCDKAFRACYRASSAHCLLQDISYHTPIKINGTIEEIGKIFSNITNKSCGLSITAKAYITGKRAGSIMVFKPNLYPFGFVGRVEFLWVKNNLQPELWLFVHPAQVKEIELILTNIINTDVGENENKKRKLDIHDVKLNLMYDQLNRFRLTGPKSHAVLAHALKCVAGLESIECNKWVLQANKDNYKMLLQEKYDYWSHISNANSPSELPPQVIIGLTVKDPRWSRPQKRTKAVSDNTSIIKSNYLINIPDCASNSPIWDGKICNVIKDNAVTNAKFIEYITKTQIVPGEINEDDPALQSIPIVLIQRPGSQNSAYKKLGYGSGWDIIIPSGYGLPFWLTFTMFGARAGGLRETESIYYEMGESYLPPDSASGRDEELRKGNSQRECYFRKPPSKRVNFIKLGINNPFNYPWTLLLKDWSDQEIDNYFVLRDKVAIKQLKDCFIKKQQQYKPCVFNSNSCLVPVYIQVIGKGCLNDHAIICLPTVEDINSKKTVCEHQHEDFNAKLRKEKRKEHKVLIKKWRRQRLKLRKKTPKVSEKKVKPKTTEPSEYVKTMQELWLTSNTKSVRNICIRETIGYVTQGAFSFTEAKSCGIGYVAYNALIKVLETGSDKVLVRRATSRKYRIASIQILNNI